MKVRILYDFQVSKPENLTEEKVLYHDPTFSQVPYAFAMHNILPLENQIDEVFCPHVQHD